MAVRTNSQTFTRIGGAMLAIVAGLTIMAPAVAETWVTFDVPGGTNPVPKAINDTGSITGSFSFNSATAGFIRRPDGTFSTFQVRNSCCTGAIAINDKGFVTGSFEKKEDPFCYLRNPNGKGILCGPVSQNESRGTAINKSAVVAGFFLDDQFVHHGFLWDKENGATDIDVPGALSTEAHSINDNGATAGIWLDANAAHAFVRDPNGTITAFDVPGAKNTDDAFIDASGIVAGDFDQGDGTAHGYVRDASGNITVFDVPGSNGTFVSGLNKKGVVVGSWNGIPAGIHGFERLPNGKIKTFDVPGAEAVGLTVPAGIDSHGDITGLFDDDVTGAQHGFLRIP